VANRDSTPNPNSRQTNPGVAGMDSIVAIANEMKTQMNVLTAKLDADTLVTDVNYASTLGITSPSVKAAF